jgi:hypothetical protein
MAPYILSATRVHVRFASWLDGFMPVSIGKENWWPAAVADSMKKTNNACLCRNSNPNFPMSVQQPGNYTDCLNRNPHHYTAD